MTGRHCKSCCSAGRRRCRRCRHCERKPKRECVCKCERERECKCKRKRDCKCKCDCEFKCECCCGCGCGCKEPCAPTARDCMAAPGLCLELSTPAHRWRICAQATTPRQEVREGEAQYGVLHPTLRGVLSRLKERLVRNMKIVEMGDAT